MHSSCRDVDVRCGVVSVGGGRCWLLSPGPFHVLQAKYFKQVDRYDDCYATGVNICLLHYWQYSLDNCFFVGWLIARVRDWLFTHEQGRLRRNRPSRVRGTIRAGVLLAE